MYEEVKTYVAAIKAAQTTYVAAMDALRVDAEHTNGRSSDCPACAASDARAEGRRAAGAASEAARGIAWQALKDSTDPLVHWIAENCESYPSSAQVILEALPAPMAVLDGIARQLGWCGDWDDLRASAARAGVLPQDAEVPA